MRNSIPSAYPTLPKGQAFPQYRFKPVPIGRLREVRVTYRRGTCPANRGSIVKRSEDVYWVFRNLADETVEVFRVAFLDSDLGLLAYEDIGRGTVDRALAHPREVFCTAIQLRASAVIVLHNHVDRDPSPSRRDIDWTLRLRAAGALLGIPLLDHVIVGQSGYFSFHDRDWKAD